MAAKRKSKSLVKSFYAYKNKRGKFGQKEDYELEKDITVLLAMYFKHDFIAAFLANWPILILDIYRGFPAFDREDYKDGDTIFTIFMFLKIFRIFRMDEIRKDTNRVRDMLGEIFYM